MRNNWIVYDDLKGKNNLFNAKEVPISCMDVFHVKYMTAEERNLFIHWPALHRVYVYPITITR